jgi:Uma2 family endonuclease
VLSLAMINLQTQFPTDTWVKATWDEYLQVIENPQLEKAKCYYHNEQLRIEMAPLGNDHASDHTVIMLAVNLFAIFKSVDFNGKDNCTYRKTGFQDAQPDASYYIGENADAISYGTLIIDLDRYPPPELVIEVANTSLSDDKGEKRILYEEMGISEYWIIDVQNVQVIDFAVADGGSKRITESQVLPGLSISLLNEAFQRTRQMNQRLVGAWLMEQFQK